MSGCQRCLVCGCLAVGDVLCADVWLSAMFWSSSVNISSSFIFAFIDCRPMFELSTVNSSLWVYMLSVSIVQHRNRMYV